MDQVGNLIESWLAFITPLRQLERFDEVRYRSLVAALESCRDKWSSETTCEFRAVDVLVDMAFVTESCSRGYPDARVRDRGLEASCELWELVHEALPRTK